MTIHTFGDSHASFGLRDCKGVKCNSIGAPLCYSFGLEKLNRCDIRNFNINNDDSVVFCFGEIDCRCHIHKHITKENTYSMIINNIVNNYIDAIKLNVNLCNVNLKNICIYNVVPPVQKFNTYENREYPFLGNDEERKTYVLYFNELLKQKCLENNWIFFNIYNNYIDKNGFLSKNLSDGNVHIKNSIYINNFINDYLL